MNLEFTELKSIDGIGTSLPNIQLLKLYHSSFFIDARSIEELQLLEHLNILTGNVEDALMLDSTQRVERLASCAQTLWIFKMSAKILTLNTIAVGGLRELDILVSKISEIKIDWEKQREKRSSISPCFKHLSSIAKRFKSKEKEDLLCNSYPCFKHLSRIAIFCLEGPKELTWLFVCSKSQAFRSVTFTKPGRNNK
ncbi:LOW QUALITY PROTEIN: hypothetical protein YC2023_075577 [Brassica napus]